jgi:hypothetical protein
MSSASVFAMIPVHKKVNERTGEQQQIWKDSKQVGPVICEEQEANDRHEDEKQDASSRT